MFMTPVEFPPDVLEKDPDRGKVDCDAYALLRQSCREAIDQGLVRREYDDVDVLAQMFWSAVHGVTSLHIVKCNNPWIQWKGVERLADAVVEAIIRGAVAEPKEVRP
jgi:hypothetical protein